MDQVCTIRQLVRRQGVSIRAVSKQLGISRKSVRRYLRDDVVPGARRETVRPKPRQEAVSKRVEEILNDAPKWTGGKQRLTGVRLHEMLGAEGVTIGMSTLYRYLR